MNGDEDKPLVGEQYYVSINDDAYKHDGNHGNTSSINTNYLPSLDTRAQMPRNTEFNDRLERARSRYVTVEIPLLLMCASLSILITLRAEYLRDRISRDVYNFNSSSSNYSQCESPDNSSNVQNDIQSTTSTWLLYLGAINAIPGMFMSIILGSVSDRLGRKFGLALSISGYLVNTVLNIVVIYFHLPILAFAPGDLIGGLGGGLGLLLSSSASYVSDVTSEKKRTFRIVLVETMLFIGFGIGQITLGFALQYSKDLTLNKYVTPLWVVLACIVASLVYVLAPWLIIETIDRKKDDGKGTSQMKKVLVGIYNLLKENHDRRRMKVIGYSIVMMFGVFVIQSFSQIFTVYSQGEPFCLGPLEISFVSVTSVVSGSLGMIVGGAVLPRFISDNWILQFSLINALVTCLITAVATTKLVLFLSAAVSLIKSLSFPVIRSQLSKVSFEHEKGLMLAFIGCMDGLSAFLSPVVSNSIYARTVYFFPPFIFYVLAALNIPACIVTG